MYNVHADFIYTLVLLITPAPYKYFKLCPSQKYLAYGIFTYMFGFCQLHVKAVFLRIVPCCIVPTSYAANCLPLIKQLYRRF